MASIPRYLGRFSPVAGIHLIATERDDEWNNNCKLVSVPLPGFIWLRLERLEVNGYQQIQVSVPLPGFIWLRPKTNRLSVFIKKVVSVPLPGFIWLRLAIGFGVDKALGCFSPVAGIHLIATQNSTRKQRFWVSFSPVAGIHLIATAWWEADYGVVLEFQSRCRDSFDCDLTLLFLNLLLDKSFSPVAGIHLIATLNLCCFLVEDV